MGSADALGGTLDGRDAPERPTVEGASGGVCGFDRPGRGDCEHFVGVPHVLNEQTTDVYGKPHDWCWHCWLMFKLRAARAALVTLLDIGEHLATDHMVAEDDENAQDHIAAFNRALDEGRAALLMPSNASEPKETA